MNQEIEVRGIVLDTSMLNEYDRRMVVLTTELGRITVFANGARRPGNRFTAASQRFVMGTFKVRMGRNSYTLVKADIEKDFLEMTRDIEIMCYASYFCELMGYYTREGISAKDELNLLYLTFLQLITGKHPVKLVRAVFECKLLDIEGEGMDTSKEKLSPSASYAISFILSRKISEVYGFSLNSSVADEVFSSVIAYTKKHCDRAFKSLDILETLG